MNTLNRLGLYLSYRCKLNLPIILFHWHFFEKLHKFIYNIYNEHNQQKKCIVFLILYDRIFLYTRLVLGYLGKMFCLNCEHLANMSVFICWNRNSFQQICIKLVLKFTSKEWFLSAIHLGMCPDHNN